MRTGFLNVVALLAGLALASTPCTAGEAFFVSDANKNVIDEVGPTGSVTPFITTHLNRPEGLAFNSAGDLFVANSGSNTIDEFSPTGTYLGTFATFQGSNEAIGPQNIAFDSAGDLYVYGQSYSVIEKLSPTGAELFSVTPTQAGLAGVAVAPDGTFYSAETNGGFSNYVIEKFSPTGADLGVFAALPGRNLQAQQMALDSSGDLFVTSYVGGGHSQIDEYSPTGVHLTTFGQAYLSYSQQPAFDAFGNVYITSSTGVVEFSPSGSYLGTYDVPSGGYPYGIAFAPQSVPEPTGLLLLAIGTAGAFVAHRHGRRISRKPRRQSGP